MATLFLERKYRLDGTELTFECEAIDRSPRRAICLFRSTGCFETAHFTLRKGGLSYGLFWSYRPYIVYRITGPGREVVGYRFDVVDRVRIHPGGVSYRDLVVDVWVDRDRRITVEDEDELAELVARGTVSETLRRRVEHVAALLVHDHGRILGEVERELGSYV